MVISLSAEDVRAVANWPLVIGALREGHRLPKADIGDTFVHARDNTMLVRSAWIDGLAAGVKAATVVPQNPDRDPALPSVHAQIMLFDDETGELSALVDGTEVTAWKTAGDSALGCDLLARQDCKTLLMVGAGSMAEPLIRAHLSVRPDIEKLLLWNRSRTRVEKLAEQSRRSRPVHRSRARSRRRYPGRRHHLLRHHDQRPVLKGRAGLAGHPCRPRRRLSARHARGRRRSAPAARWFVDSFDTTLDHIGELKTPLEAGIITRDADEGRLHTLVAVRPGRHPPTRSPSSRTAAARISTSWSPMRW